MAARHGISGDAQVRVDVSRMPRQTRYVLPLYLAELEDHRPGERVFDVKVCGKTVLSSLDVAAEAGAPRSPLVRQCETSSADGAITVQLVGRKGAPIPSALEIRPGE